MVRFLISLLLVAAVLPRPVWADMSGGAIPASYYVQDGLIAQWDGIENAGVGKHDLGATAWKDLVGSRDLRLNASCGYFRHNSLYCACTTSGYAAGGADACTTYSTIELRCDPNPNPIPNSSYQSAYIFCAGDTSNYRMFAQNPSGFLVRTGSSYYNRPGEAATCSATYSGSSADEYYTNGAPTKALSSGTWSNRGNKIAVGNGYSVFTYPYSGNVYTIRLYSRALSQAELARNAMLDYARFSAPHDTRYLGDATSGTLECRVVFESCDPARGTVSCTVAGVAKSGGVVWAGLEETVVLKPTAKSGYRWVKWTGDLDGVAVAFDGTATFAGRAKRLTAWFLPTATMASPRTWTGNGGNPYWDTAGNWNPEGVPGTDDFVLIDKPSAKVLVRTSTAELSTLTLGGTAAGVASIVCTNWMTQIKAQEIVVRNYGELTSGAMPLNTDMSNRVWLVCRDLDLQAGGKINVDNLGYTNNNGPAWDSVSGTIDGAAGGSHGGLSSLGAGANRSHCYGSLTQPEAPGSGGYRYSTGAGARGGGAVKIEASRNVRIDGTVTARGQACNIWNYGGGSGGSIFISSQTIRGSGEVNVGSVDQTGPYGHSGGGGGRLAVHYDPVLQSEFDAACQIRFTARGGIGSIGVLHPYGTSIPASPTTGYVRPLATMLGMGEAGTMWFTDYRLLTNEVRLANGVLLSGRFYSGVPLPERLRLGGPILFKSSFLELDDEIGLLEIDGDVKMEGPYYVTSGLKVTNTTLVVHGDVDMRGSLIRQIGGKTTIEGDLTMATSTAESVEYSSRLDVQAMDMTGTDSEFGALFGVKGTWTMRKFSVVYPRAEKVTGYVPFFDCLNLDMRPNSYFDAQLTGYGIGNGPGYGKGATGSSHGGRGGSTTGNKSKIPETYGDYKRPVTAGSGSNQTHPGGGAICVRARNRMDLNGFVVAHGNGYSSNWCFGSSGGSVFLSAARFSSTNGYISVRGGKTTQYSVGSGGGGRVSICARALLSTNVVVYLNGGDPISQESVPAEPGTLYWFDNPGSMFLIR